MRLTVLLVVFHLSIIAGCAEEDEEPVGQAPTIADLVVSPEVVAVGAQTTVNGSLTFDDPDGDVASIGFELRPEVGPLQRLDGVEVAGAAGLTVGQVPFFIIVQAAEPGPIELGLWLVDEAGNESNELVADLIATME